MKIALVDDEQTELSHLSELIQSQLSFLGDAVKIDTFSSSAAFLAVWTLGSYDLIVLDIYMNKPDGIEVARRVRETDKNVRLVFCTSSNEFASESYEVHAQYYLCKPITEKEIAAMFQRLDMGNYELERQIYLPDGQKLILHNIIYTEYFNHIVTIHNQKGAAIQTRISHAQLECMLCEYPCFCCCSRGVIVNFHAVLKLSMDTFLMNNGTKVPISRRKFKEVQDSYARFLFEKTRAEVNNHATFLPNR